MKRDPTFSSLSIIYNFIKISCYRVQWWLLVTILPSNLSPEINLTKALSFHRPSLMAPKELVSPQCRRRHHRGTLSRNYISPATPRFRLMVICKARLSTLDYRSWYCNCGIGARFVPKPSLTKAACARLRRVKVVASRSKRKIGR